MKRKLHAPGLLTVNLAFFWYFKLTISLDADVLESLCRMKMFCIYLAMCLPCQTIGSRCLFTASDEVRATPKK